VSSLTLEENVSRVSRCRASRMYRDPPPAAAALPPSGPPSITKTKSCWKKKSPNPKNPRRSRLITLTTHFLAIPREPRPLGRLQHRKELGGTEKKSLQRKPGALRAHILVISREPRAIGKASAASGAHRNGEKIPATKTWSA
jgi:hypothetical protein